MLNPQELAKLLAETFYPDDQTDSDNPRHTTIRVRAILVNEGDTMRRAILRSQCQNLWRRAGPSTVRRHRGLMVSEPIYAATS